MRRLVRALKYVAKVNGKTLDKGFAKKLGILPPKPKPKKKTKAEIAEEKD